MLSLFGIFIGLFILMFLAYRGHYIVWVAPVAAGLVALLSGMNVIEAYMGPYMTGLVGFVYSWFPAFMLSAIFGNIMDVTGSARAIATWLMNIVGEKAAIATVVIGASLLTYGGISLFVVVFAMYPIALAVFEEANITRKLIPGAIALGAFGYTMTAIPGTPQIQNLIPMEHFGTSPTAAPIMGIVATVSMFTFGMIWLESRRKSYEEKGVFYTQAENQIKVDETNLPNPYLSLIPLVVVVVVLNFVPALIGLSNDSPYNIVYALLAGIGTSVIFNLNKREKFLPAISNGSQGAVGAILNTAAAVGFGSVVGAVPGFAVLTKMMLSVPGTPLISLAIAVNIMAGATGSASGGMGIALEALGAEYLQLAKTAGISPQAFHRISSLASGGMDTLPHNGAVVTLLENTEMTHKDSYLDIFMVSLVNPLIASIIVIILASFGIY